MLYYPSTYTMNYVPTKEQEQYSESEKNWAMNLKKEAREYQLEIREELQCQYDYYEIECPDIADCLNSKWNKKAYKQKLRVERKLQILDAYNITRPSNEEKVNCEPH